MTYIPKLGDTISSKTTTPAGTEIVSTGTIRRIEMKHGEPIARDANGYALWTPDMEATLVKAAEVKEGVYVPQVGDILQRVIEAIDSDGNKITTRDNIIVGVVAIAETYPGGRYRAYTKDRADLLLSWLSPEQTTLIDNPVGNPFDNLDSDWD